MRLLDIKPLHIEKIMTAVADQGRRVNTVKAVRRVIFALFAAADRNSLIPNNPAAKTRTPKPRQGETSRKPVPFTQKEIQKVLMLLQSHPHELLFLWSMSTGMRRGEVLAVQWSDITIDESGAQVVVSKQIKEDRVYSQDGKYSVVRTVSRPKTTNSNRIVYLPAFLVAKLENYRNELRKDNTVRGWNDDELIFSQPDGSALWPSNVTLEWTKFLRNNGMRHIQLHGLRHTFAVMALANDAPLEAVSEALGHHSIAITKDMYAAKVPGLARKATSAISNILPDVKQGAGGINHREA